MRSRIIWLARKVSTRRGAIGSQRVATQLAWEYSVPQLLRAYSEGLGLAGRGADAAVQPLVGAPLQPPEAGR